MSLLRISRPGYPTVVIEQEPGRGRISGGYAVTSHVQGMTLAYGELVQGEPGNPRREANREAARRLRDRRR